MTMSQIDLLSRAVRLQEIGHYRTLLAITHNPYAKDRIAAGRLMSAFQAEESRLRSSGLLERRPAGISLSDLRRAFGPLKREEVPRERWAAMQAEREAAKERARARGLVVPENGARG